MSMFWYCFRERETILDLFEMSSGQRMHTRYFQVGGVIEDIPAGFEAKLREFLDDHADPRRPVRDLLRRTRSCCSACAAPARSTRRRCSGSASPGRCCAPPATRGTCARPPVLELRPLRVQDPGRHGRRQLRPLPVRHAEIYESVKIIEQALDGLPEGPHITDRPQGRAAAAPRARDLDGGADPPLQARHRGLPRAAGRGLLPDRVAPRRARLLRPLRRLLQARRVHMRDPSFVNLQATAPMVKDAYIADLIATLAMLDPILGGIDR
jgi:NADH-quinone oxidoreductase subunit D